MSQLHRVPIRALRPIAVSTLIVGLVLIGATAATAQSLTGGCQATAGKRTVPSMTRDNPLVLSKGKRLRVNASVPASNPDATTNLDVKVGPVSNSYSFTGARYNNSFKPPSWVFTIADGIVKFSGTATGEGFSCKGDGYVKIDGDGLLALVGGTLLAGAGAAGVATASGPKTPPAPDNLPPKAQNKIALTDVIKQLKAEMGKDFALSLAMLIILIFVLIFER